MSHCITSSSGIVYIQVFCVGSAGFSKGWVFIIPSLINDSYRCIVLYVVSVAYLVCCIWCIYHYASSVHICLSYSVAFCWFYLSIDCTHYNGYFEATLTTTLLKLVDDTYRVHVVYCTHTTFIARFVQVLIPVLAESVVSSRSRFGDFIMRCLVSSQHRVLLPISFTIVLFQFKVFTLRLMYLFFFLMTVVSEPAFPHLD